MSPQRSSKPLILALILVLSLFQAVIAQAEEESASPKTVIKRLAYINGEDLREILGMLPLKIVIKADLDTIVLRGRPAPIETALAMIDSMDVPATLNPSIELRGYILAVAKGDESVDIPKHLNKVTAELRNIFGYTSYRLIDTIFLRTSHGSGASVGGSASLPESIVQVPYILGFNRAWITNFDRSRTDKETKNIVRLNGLTLRRDQPAISTDIEILEGQTAVIGKARLDDRLGDLILVVEAKVIVSEP